MNRLACLLLLLAAPALAHAQPAPPQPKPPSRVVVARPDPKAVDHAPAIQAAIDAAQAGATAWRAADMGFGSTARAVVTIPAGSWVLGSPLWIDQGLVEVRGEGEASRLRLASPLDGHPPFLVGWPRDAGAGTDVPDATYRPEVTALFDGTTGRRWGLATRGKMAGLGHAGPFSHGPTTSDAAHPGSPDLWGYTRRFAIDCAFVGPVPAGAYLFGIGANGYGPSSPWTLSGGATADSFNLLLTTVNARFGAPTNRYFTFALPAGLDPAALRRVVVQVDYDAGAVAAFVGSPTGNAPLSVSGTLPPGSIPRENPCDSFVIGGPPGSNPADFTLAGLCLAAAPRYGADGTRADGKPITDMYRYFPPPVTNPPDAYDATAIGCLAFDEDPATAPRCLAIQGCPASSNRSGALLLSHAGMFRPVGSVSFADLRIDGGSPYGTCIALGQALDVRLERVRLAGGTYGLSSLPVAPQYPVVLQDCTLAGGDSGVYGEGMILYMQGGGFANNGRVALRLRGCNATVRDVFVSTTGSPQYAFALIYSGQYGGQFLFDGCSSDNEGVGYDLAYIYAERNAYGASQLAIRPPMYAGTVGGVPLLRLRDVAPTSGTFPQAYFWAQGLTGDTSGPVVEVDGPGWAGTLADCVAGGGQVANVGTFQGTPSVKLSTSLTTTDPGGTGVLAQAVAPGRDGWGAVAAGVLTIASAVGAGLAIRRAMRKRAA